MVSSRMQNEIPALLALAYEHTDAARLALAGKLADFLLSDHDLLNDHEKSLMNELISDLLKNQNPLLRQALAQTFAHAHKTPREIAVKLMTQPIDIARGVLAYCTTLTDHDLVQVVETQSRAHAEAVALRQTLSEAVADALVTTGDLHIMQIVAENLGATLSPYALRALTESARLAHDLQDPLLHRPDFPAPLAQKLYWWVEHDLRRLTLARFGFSSGQIDQALMKTIEEKLDAHILERHNDTAMIRVFSWLEERGAVTTKILPQLLRIGHFRLFNMALSHINNLPLPTVDAIVSGTGGQMMAALCKNMNIEKSGFVSIFLLSRGARHDEQVVHPHELAEALRAFDRMTDADARNLVYTWRENPELLDAREEQILEA